MNKTKDLTISGVLPGNPAFFSEGKLAEKNRGFARLSYNSLAFIKDYTNIIY